MTDTKCTTCDGCGQLADSDGREPWSVWENLPARSALAVVMGFVKPVPCDVCGGTGKARAFTPADVRDLLSSADGDYDDGLNAFVSIRQDSNTELTVSLTTTEDNKADRTTEKFRVVITRTD